MKAEEYAQVVSKAITDNKQLSPHEQIDYVIEAVHTISVDFLAEASDLIKSRRCATQSAVAAVFREQYSKWRAMVRITTRDTGEELLDPEGFKVLVQTAWPEMYKYLNKNGWK